MRGKAELDEAVEQNLRGAALWDEVKDRPHSTTLGLHTEVDIPHMANLGLQMLKEALNAFVNHEPAKARAIIPRDKQIDSLNKQLQRELASYMIERPSTISRCLHLMTISKSLERIGDHATNIAEEVVYLHEGEDIRHDPKVKAGVK